MQRNEPETQAQKGLSALRNRATSNAAYPNVGIFARIFARLLVSDG